MDAWVTCKCRLVCDTKLDCSTFELIGMQTLFNTPLLFVKQVFKCVQRDAKLFTISVHEPINEFMNENGTNEKLRKLFKEIFDVFHVDIPNLLCPFENLIVDHAMIFIIIYMEP